MIIAGYIRFPKALRVNLNCLDIEMDIIVNSIPGKVLTPKLPEIISDDINALNRLEDPDPEILVEQNRLWGVLLNDDSANIYSCKIEFEVAEDLIMEVGEKLYNALPTWIVRLKDNLTTLGHYINIPMVLKRKLDEEKEYFDLFYMKEGKILNPYVASDSYHHIIDLTKMDCNDLQRAFKLTSENKNPILEFRLLNDAKFSLLLGDFRKSILDSATAFELCLTNSLRRELKLDQPLLNEILTNYNSIDKKRKLLKIIGRDLPKEHNYKDDLETLRNRAIHIGREPHAKEAKTAYKIAEKIVRLLSADRFE